eukprot:713244-Pelagomonas_calceolata.AAC.2
MLCGRTISYSGSMDTGVLIGWRSQRLFVYTLMLCPNYCIPAGHVGDVHGSVDALPLSSSIVCLLPCYVNLPSAEEEPSMVVSAHMQSVIINDGPLHFC